MPTSRHLVLEQAHDRNSTNGAGEVVENDLDNKRVELTFWSEGGKIGGRTILGTSLQRMWGNCPNGAVGSPGPASREAVSTPA